MPASAHRPPARTSLRPCKGFALGLAWLLLFAAGPGRTQDAEPADGIPTARSTPTGSGPQLLARIVDGAQDFDEWHELEIELSVGTDGARYLVRRLRVLPSDEVEPDCADVQRMGRLVLPAQATTVLPPLELKVSERQRSSWLTRLLQRQHRRYVVLAIELQRLDPAATTAIAPAAHPVPADPAGLQTAVPAALAAPAQRCPDTVGPDDQQYEWLFATLPVLIDTPPWSMHAGAVCGAVLSTLFAFVSARRGDDPAPGRPPRRSPGALFSEIFMTTLACLIAVVLLQSTSSSAAGEAGLPLQVAVKDFYGGLLIGLFGRQIVGFVRRRLNGETDAPAGTPSKAAAPPPPPAPPVPAGEVPALTRLPGPSGTGPLPAQTGDRP